jgi:hypothetical protein
MKTDANTSRGSRNLKAALALALLVWAGPASTQEVQVEPVGQWPGFARGPAYAVAVAGQYAYVAAGLAGLQVIDVSDPGNPRLVGGLDTPGSAEGVAVSGQYAYVADGEWGLHILRIGDAATPPRAWTDRSG